MVKLLLSHGASPNKLDSDGMSPLCRSIIFGRATVVELLLDHGAAVDGDDESYTTPL